MTSPTNIALIVLLILTAFFGALSYHFSNAKAGAESALVVAIDANTSLQKSLNLQVEACKIDDTSIAKVQAEKQELQNQINDVTNQIAALKSGIKKPTNSGITKNVETTSPIVGSELLSDELTSLLHTSYCSTEPDSCLPSK